ncbi:acyl-CoA dehydrogenase family protein [Nocardioides sp. Soil796]|uniref:acyl-CoA dehydrogenase family protein n=1 Tax=Nocardioides sp. Soil796 TaxID=1736412 RepID=UPI00070F4C40|nr:acyl-CoA dehydrogenase family protein [Nocardioides sp. Soil796]KRF10416.1 acyl-CoA dehydrogenase [Nocardioides sp. Soil796]
MHFGLSEEQEELAGAVRTLVERRAGQVDLRAATQAARGFDEALWETLCGQIGVAALAIPEEYGGAGFSTFETHVVLETLGRTLTPTPLLGSGVLATRAVLLAGTPDDCARLLPPLAEGTHVAALAWADASGQWRADGSDVRATADGDSWRLDGAATLVLDAHGADLLLVVAATEDGPRLFEADLSAGVERTATPALDLTLQLDTVTFDGAPATPVGGVLTDELATLRAEAAVAVTALQVGGAQGALDRTVAHLKEREQFGRPLGSFQALKHRVADLLVAVETSRSISWSAAWAAAQGDADVVRQAALAKAWCSEAFAEVAAEMVQLHGGIAITWEHDAHLFFKRAHATGELFGSAREHRRSLLPA